MFDTTSTMVGDLEILETTINGRRYEMTRLECDYAADLKADLLKLMGGPLSQAFGALGSDALDEEIDMAKLAAAVSMIPAAISAAGGSALYARILKNVTRFAQLSDGKMQKQQLREPRMRDALLNTGGWEEFYSVLAWAIWENYRSFFPALRNAYNGLSLMLKASPSATTSEA